MNDVRIFYPIERVDWIRKYHFIITTINGPGHLLFNWSSIGLPQFTFNFILRTPFALPTFAFVLSSSRKKVYGTLFLNILVSFLV